MAHVFAWNCPGGMHAMNDLATHLFGLSPYVYKPFAFPSTMKNVHECFLIVLLAPEAAQSFPDMVLTVGLSRSGLSQVFCPMSAGDSSHECMLTTASRSSEYISCISTFSTSEKDRSIPSDAM